ncbi:MAG: hypothetical protein C0391_05425 [Anaerolinea sp.]|nr:hypothetical protein [Anaerolinea sp.]
MNVISRLLTRKQNKPQRTKLAVSINDGFIERPAGGDMARDRYTGDRMEILRQSLEAWQTNPLARRIVELTSQYVVGGGVSISSAHPGTDEFIRQWWNHPLNRMDVRCTEWCEELSRSGELFILISTGADGMSYLRAVPAVQIKEIVPLENDLEQELEFIEYPGVGSEERHWKAWGAVGEELPFQPVMRHYAINRPVGALHGESDLAPLLRWLARYSAWLEDRVRLNRYRQAFMYQVKAAFTSEQERMNRQQALNAAPPNPGSILVTDESETWSVIQPQLASQEAGEDGLAVKRMVAAGAGIPLHFLAEPEGATRTTAEFAGGPTFRRFEQRQRFFLWMLEDLTRIVLIRKAQVNRRVKADALLSVRGADISNRDNGALAEAAGQIVTAFLPLVERGLVDDAELLRLAYRFAGEVYGKSGDSQMEKSA